MMSVSEIKYLDCRNHECPGALNIDECRRLNRGGKCLEEG